MLFTPLQARDLRSFSMLHGLRTHTWCCLEQCAGVCSCFLSAFVRKKPRKSIAYLQYNVNYFMFERC